MSTALAALWESLTLTRTLTRRTRLKSGLVTTPLAALAMLALGSHVKRHMGSMYMRWSGQRISGGYVLSAENPSGPLWARDTTLRPLGIVLHLFAMRRFHRAPSQQREKEEWE